MPAHSYRRLEPRSRVILFMRDGQRYEGRYVGLHGPTARDPERYILLDRSDEVSSVPASEVRRIAVDVGGKGWLYGAIAGGVVDTALVALVVIAASSDLSGDYSRSGMMKGM